MRGRQGEGYFSHHDVIIQYTYTIFKLSKELWEYTTVQKLVKVVVHVTVNSRVARGIIHDSNLCDASRHEKTIQTFRLPMEAFISDDSHTQTLLYKYRVDDRCHCHLSPSVIHPVFIQ